MTKGAGLILRPFFVCKACGRPNKAPPILTSLTFKVRSWPRKTAHSLTRKSISASKPGASAAMLHLLTTLARSRPEGQPIAKSDHVAAHGPGLLGSAVACSVSGKCAKAFQALAKPGSDASAALCLYTSKGRFQNCPKTQRIRIPMTLSKPNATVYSCIHINH